MTLAFLGDRPSAHLSHLRVLGATLNWSGAVELNAIEHWQNSQVLVVVAQENPQELLAKTMELEATAVTLAAAKPRERWRAHVTLARKVLQPPVLSAMSPIDWRSSSFCLMSSTLSGTESVYTVVESWPLLDKR